MRKAAQTRRDPLEMLHVALSNKGEKVHKKKERKENKKKRQTSSSNQRCELGASSFLKEQKDRSGVLFVLAGPPLPAAEFHRAPEKPPFDS